MGCRALVSLFWLAENNAENRKRQHSQNCVIVIYTVVRYKALLTRLIASNIWTSPIVLDPGYAR